MHLGASGHAAVGECVDCSVQGSVQRPRRQRVGFFGLRDQRIHKITHTTHTTHAEMGLGSGDVRFHHHAMAGGREACGPDSTPDGAAALGLKNAGVCVCCVQSVYV